MEKEDKGFLLIQKTYSVACLNCDWEGQAVLGKEPIIDASEEGPMLCPVCNTYALVGKAYKDGNKIQRSGK